MVCPIILGPFLDNYYTHLSDTTLKRIQTLEYGVTLEYNVTFPSHIFKALDDEILHNTHYSIVFEINCTICDNAECFLQTHSRS